MPTEYDNHSDMAHDDAPRRPVLDFTLSVEAASDLFAAAGVPRSIRSVQRFCQKGHLDCIPVDTELGQKYLVSRESVDRRMRELRQIEQVMRTAGAPVRAGSRTDAPDRAEPRQDATAGGTVAVDRIRELESKVRSLEIDKAVRQQLIERLDGDRARLHEQVERYVTQLIEKSREIGQMETKLLQIEVQGELAGDGQEYRVFDTGEAAMAEEVEAAVMEAADERAAGDNPARRLPVQGLE